MEEMGTLVNLQDLWFASNAIKKIRPCLVGCTSLRTLELGFNRVKRIENLESLTTLQNLWLGRNRIRTIENLSMLINLQKLDVQSNRLTKIEGLSTLVHLEQLYLSHNRISRLENLETLVCPSYPLLSGPSLRGLISNHTFLALFDSRHPCEYWM